MRMMLMHTRHQHQRAACDPALAAKLLAELDAAEQAASKARAARREPLTKAALLAALDLVRGAVMIAYPMGLPEWDFVRECLEGRDGAAASADVSRATGEWALGADTRGWVRCEGRPLRILSPCSNAPRAHRANTTPPFPPAAVWRRGL